MRVAIKSLLENTATQVICLPRKNLLDGQTKVNVLDLGLRCIFGKSCCLEGGIECIEWQALVQNQVIPFASGLNIQVCVGYR